MAKINFGGVEEEGRGRFGRDVLLVGEQLDERGIGILAEEKQDRRGVIGALGETHRRH